MIPLGPPSGSGKAYPGKLRRLTLKLQQPKPPEHLARAPVSQPVPPLPRLPLPHLNASDAASDLGESRNLLLSGVCIV